MLRWMMHQQMTESMHFLLPSCIMLVSLFTFFHLLKLNYASFRKSNFLPVSDDGEQACLSLTLQIFNLLTVMVKVPLQIFLQPDGVGDVPVYSCID